MDAGSEGAAPGRRTARVTKQGRGDGHRLRSVPPSAMLTGMDVFYTYVLPILVEMSATPLRSFPLQQRIREMGITDEDESTRLIDLMKGNGLITFGGQKNGAGVWYVVHDVYLTPKGLAQLNMWPADNERALHLLEQVIAALDDSATDAESTGGNIEQAGRFRSAARSLRSVMAEASTEIAAKVVANVVTGG
jgi:hypothetical protein